MVQDWSRESIPRHQTFQPQYYSTEAARHHSLKPERYSPDVVRGHSSFSQDRCSFEGTEHGRFQDASDLRRQPPMQIDEALRSHCGIAAKQYFVAAVMDDGTPMTFFSPSLGQRLGESVIRQFFDAARYRQVMSRIDAGADPMLDDGFGLEDGMLGRPSPFSRSRMTDRRRSSALGDWTDSPARQGRKRARGRPVNDEDDAPMTVSSRRGIRIGDSAAIWSFYEQRFKNCQQTACKLIAKAWVKAVEPKKQSTHPYTGSDEKAPDWWPKPWGPTKDDKVRHKEPDHLYKRERVHLLAHILRLVVEPNDKQHMDIQKLGLNVKKLEETTAEVLSSFFMDTESNARKRPYLNEIFKVARQEERYKNGEIDGSTEVYVMAEDKVPEPESFTSDNEDAGVNKDEEDHDVSRTKTALTQMQGLQHALTIEAGSTTNMRGNGFLNDMSVRSSQFSQQPMMADMTVAQQHSFVEGGGLPVHATQPVTMAGATLTLDMVTTSHDGSGRRPSVYSEYASPATNMYPQQWPPASTGANAAPLPSLYPYATQQSSSQAGSFVGQAVAMSASQSYMGSSFEGSARAEYDPNGNAMFRAGDMPQGSVGQPQGYGYEMPDDGRGMRVMTQVVGPVHRGPI